MVYTPQEMYGRSTSGKNTSYAFPFIAGVVVGGIGAWLVHELSQSKTMYSKGDLTYGLK